MTKTILEAALNQLRKHVREFQEAIDGIPDEDLNQWKPAAEHDGGGEMSTFAGLSVHTTQAASWRIVHQVYGLDYPRDRDSEFSARASRSEIDERFDRMLDRFAELIDTESMPDLTSLPPTIRPDSPDWSRGEYLIQAVSHTALHLGHVQIHRQLWLVERGGTNA